MLRQELTELRQAIENLAQQERKAPLAALPIADAAAASTFWTPSDSSAPPPVLLTSDESKINIVIGLLRGRALTLTQTSSSSTSLTLLSFEEFVKCPNHAGCMAKRLFTI